jgi:hypothetical protein
VGKPVDFAKFEHKTAAVWQGFDGLRQETEFLGTADRLHHAGLIFQDVQVRVFNYALMQINSPAPEEIEGDVPRRSEKKAAGRVQLAINFRADDFQVGFLNNIIDVGERGKLPPQVSS